MLLLRLNLNEYWTSAWQTLRYADIFMGLIKPVLFGFIIATVGCYYGMSAKGGTQGVGRATTQAVVAASVLILAVDLFVTRLLMVAAGAFIDHERGQRQWDANKARGHSL